jgi:hypothetical protein
MAVPDVYLSGKNAKAVLDGVEYPVEDGSITDGFETDETTNNESGGSYEDVVTIDKATVTGLRIVYKTSKKPTFRPRDVIPINIYIDNGPSLTGDFRVGPMTVPLLNLRSAVRMTFDLTSQGAYTFDPGS